MACGAERSIFDRARKDHDDVPAKTSLRHWAILLLGSLQRDQDSSAALDVTPRWLLHLLSWVPVEAGIYRVNRVVNPERVAVKAESGAGTDEPLPETYVDYETSRANTPCARSRHCSTSTLGSPTCTPARTTRCPAAAADHRDDQGTPGIRTGQQPRVRVAGQATPEQTIQTLGGAPTPDDLDALITRSGRRRASS